MDTEGSGHPGLGTGMFGEGAVQSIMSEMETANEPVGLTKRYLGPGQVWGVGGMKLNGCRLGRAFGATLTAFNFERGMPRTALKQPNDSVVLVRPPTPKWLWIRISLGVEGPWNYK